MDKYNIDCIYEKLMKLHCVTFFKMFYYVKKKGLRIIAICIIMQIAGNCSIWLFPF